MLLFYFILIQFILFCSNKQVFEPRVPLVDAISVLTQIWEDDGMYEHVAKIEAYEARMDAKRAAEGRK